MHIKTDGLFCKTSPKVKRPGEYWGKFAARDAIKRSGNPTRRQRLDRYEIEEALERERRSWFK